MLEQSSAGSTPALPTKTKSFKPTGYNIKNARPIAIKAKETIFIMKCFSSK